MNGVWIPRRPHGPRGGDRYFLSGAAVTVDNVAPVAIAAALFRDSAPSSGWLAGQRLDSRTAAEALAGQGRDAATLAEAVGQTAASLNSAVPIAVLALADVDARAPVEAVAGALFRDSAAAVAIAATLFRDSAAPAAIAATLFRDSAPLSEWLAEQRLDTLAAVEALGGQGYDAAMLAEATGQTAASLDSGVPIAVLALTDVDARAPMEAVAATGSPLLGAPVHLAWTAQLQADGAAAVDVIASPGAASHVLIELLSTADKNHVGSAEMLAPAAIDAGVRTEWLGRAITVIDAFGAVETTGSLRGDSAITYDAMKLTALAGDYLLPLEIGIEIPTPVQPIPQISGSRLRLLPADGNDVRPFDPIAPDEIDTFAFDLSGEIGQAEIVSTTWTCRMLPYQPGNGYAGTISAPGPYIFGNSTADMVQASASLSGQSGLTLTGKFALAEIGGFPATAAGSWFAITVRVALSDGRRLRSAAPVLCSSNGRT